MPSIPQTGPPAHPTQNDAQPEPQWREKYAGPIAAAKVLILLFGFMVGVGALGDGFKLLGRDLLESFFQATSNPFVALMVGLLSTTLVQSSSVTTSLVVGLVAAPVNPLPLSNAVPMIMGANIGTTVTNTLVSIAHMGRKDEFRRAFSVATCHDFFNYFTVLVLLPLEITTGFLSHAADAIAQQVTAAGGVNFESPVASAIDVGAAPIQFVANHLFSSPQWQGITVVFASAVLIFGCLLLLVQTMKRLMGRRVEGLVEKVLGRSAMLGMLIGLIATVLVQSSSITTSLLVPLAGAGLITLEQAFPVTLGANVGTTVTAVLASMAVSGPNAHFGVAIALTHLLFNVLGILIIYPIRKIRQIPLGAARMLAGYAVRSKYLALFYIALLFYVLPAIFAFVHN